MKEFLYLANSFRGCPIVDDDFPELRDRFDHALNNMTQTLPDIVCLCGSTRFKDAFDEAVYQETMAGKIVLSVGFFMHASGNRHGENIGCTPEQKIGLDALHFRKIELADEILVLNVDGYIGESTRNEINHATSLGKIIRYLETV